jgi:hypothetical protein
MRCEYEMYVYFSLAISGVQFRMPDLHSGRLCSFPVILCKRLCIGNIWSRQDRVSGLQRVQSWIKPRRGPCIMVNEVYAVSIFSSSLPALPRALSLFIRESSVLISPPRSQDPRLSSQDGPCRVLSFVFLLCAALGQILLRLFLSCSFPLSSLSRSSFSFHSART